MMGVCVSWATTRHNNKHVIHYTSRIPLYLLIWLYLIIKMVYSLFVLHIFFIILLMILCKSTHIQTHILFGLYASKGCWVLAMFQYFT